MIESHNTFDFLKDGRGRPVYARRVHLNSPFEGSSPLKLKFGIDKNPCLYSVS